MWRKILNILSWSLLAAYLGVSIWFTEGQLKLQRFQAVRVIVVDSLESRFIEPADITGILSTAGIRITGSPMVDLNRDQVTKTVKTVSGVKEALVYSTPDGLLWINVSQRKPILRFVSPFVSFYIDAEGKEMPLSNRFTAEVMIVTGSGDRRFLADSLSPVVKYISEDRFLNAMISEILVYPDHSLEVIPRIGDNRIFLGDAGNFAWKLTKLKIFYEQGQPTVGWDKYSRINLAFSNQVVARVWSKEQRSERDSIRMARDTTLQDQRVESRE